MATGKAALAEDANAAAPRELFKRERLEMNRDMEDTVT
jgi:hypothetical protein